MQFLRLEHSVRTSDFLSNTPHRNSTESRAGIRKLSRLHAAIKTKIPARPSVVLIVCLWVGSHNSIWCFDTIFSDFTTFSKPQRVATGSIQLLKSTFWSIFWEGKCCLAWVFRYFAVRFWVSEISKSKGITSKILQKSRILENVRSRLCAVSVGGSYPHELTKANPIDPQDEEETKDDLEHVPIESNDHYDIDIAEDSMEEDQ